ncbi:MAG: hypothetical protein ACFFCS_04265 [Candidatus Hodarchaeota archaeon]
MNDKEKEDNNADDSMDLITIVESVEKEIPEKKPPFDDVLFDFIPESQMPVTATKDDHVSKEHHEH